MTFNENPKVKIPDTKFLESMQKIHPSARREKLKRVGISQLKTRL